MDRRSHRADAVNHIAVIHMGAIGDLVQALPVLRALRVRWPGVRLTLVGRPERTVLARMAGLADACVDYDISPTVAGADLIIDFLSAASADDAAHIWVHPLPPADWTETAAAWLLREVSAQIPLPHVPMEPEVPVPEAVLAAAREILHEADVDGPFVAVHPGSGSVRKNWPMDRFAEIARRMREEGRRQVVWLAGPAERDRGTLGAASLTAPLLTEQPLDTVAGILALADAYVGNDSGITHLAAAVRRPDGRCTPTVALFGPTNAALWAPRGRHVRLVRSENATMDAISVDDAWAAVRPLLA
jgi:heptosyltransferase III